MEPKADSLKRPKEINKLLPRLTEEKEKTNIRITNMKNERRGVTT